MGDYDWSCEAPVDGTTDATAEQWLRAAWEDGPLVLRVLLPVGWKYGLGLRLGSRSDLTRVLGWHIVDSVPKRVSVDADSPFMRAENIVTVDGGRVRWRTVVTHKSAAGRALWIPAKVVHQWLVPRSLRRAIRRHSDH